MPNPAYPPSKAQPAPKVTTWPAKVLPGNTPLPNKKIG